MHSVASIDAAIIEYLMHQGMTRAAEAVKEERQFHSGSSEANRRQKQLDDLLAAFDKGDCALTIELWEQNLNDQPPPKLGFYVHVYFAIFPLLKGKPHKNPMPGASSSAMEGFRSFLQEYSKRVDVPPECLSFYALPFVHDPANHESFKHLFKAGWLEDLRLEYIAFLEDHMKLHTVRTPLLIHMFSNKDQDLDVQSFSPNQPTTSAQNNAGSRLSDEEGSLMRSFDSAPIDQITASFPIENLDIGRISNVLCSPVFDVRKAELLQALRWNLTQPQTQSARRTILHLYISQDLLQCSPKSSTEPTDGGSVDMLSCLLSSEDDLVKDGALRLLSSIANYYSGRSYLLQHLKLTTLLCHAMTNAGNANTDVHLNALCILQKFSMRRGPESQMINLGVVEYLGRLLSDYQRLSEETIEFATALLFNLSLRTNGKIRFENNPKNMIALLMDLLEIDSPEVRHFICGTFTSVLSRPQLKEKAQRLNAASAFTVYSSDTEETKQQIRAILEQLNAPILPQMSNLTSQANMSASWASSDQDDDDPDYISAQEEDDNLVEQFDEDLDDELCGVSGGGLRGANLLQVQYCSVPVNRELDYAKETGKVWSGRNSS